MVFDESVQDIVKKAVKRYPSDINKAVDQTWRYVKALPNFDELVEDFIKSALRAAVHDFRHTGNTALKREAGEYGKPATVCDLNSEGLKQIYCDLYAIHIAGTVLGELIGGTLIGIANSEAAKANGHAFNAKLLQKLHPLVPEGVRVRDAVNPAKLQAIVTRLQREELRDAG